MFRIPTGWPAQRLLLLGLAGALSFGVAALTGLLVVRLATGLATLWPSDAILLALVMRQGRAPADRSALLLGGFLGGALCCALRGLPTIDCVMVPIAVVMEVALAGLLLRLASQPGDLRRVIDVVVMMGASVVAPLVPALIAAGAITHSRGHGFGESWVFWYRAGALSLACATPAALIGLRTARHLWRGKLASGPLVRAALAVALVAGATAIIFIHSTVPALYAIMPVALIPTFRFRQPGAMAATVVIAVMSLVATEHGIGPIAAATPDPGQQGLLLQLFVAVILLTLLPVAAVLTERDQRAEEARMLASQLKAVVENVGEVIFRIDPRGRWTYLNPAWETVSGLAVMASLGAPWLARMEDEDDPVADWAEPVLHGTVSSAARTMRFRTADGEPRWIEVSIERLLDGRGVAAGGTGTLRDITDRKRLEQHVLSAKRRAEERAREATALASTDDLTGLANRRAFLGRLESEVGLAAAKGHALTVAIFDVDHFKTVNDRFGHAMGDRVLQGVAARAEAVLRGDDLVGRIGGEEFGVVMPRARLEDAGEVAERLRHAIERGGAIGEGEETLPTVTVSIGLATLAPGDDAAALLQAADRALYAAKDGGRNRVRLAA